MLLEVLPYISEYQQRRSCVVWIWIPCISFGSCPDFSKARLNSKKLIGNNFFFFIYKTVSNTNWCNRVYVPSPLPKEVRCKNTCYILIFKMMYTFLYSTTTILWCVLLDNSLGNTSSSLHGLLNACSTVWDKMVAPVITLQLHFDHCQSL